jgi:hypothetical protein
MRHLTLALAFFSGLYASPASATLACPPPRPPCDEFGRAGAVFVGTVVKFQNGEVTFAVQESFSGPRTAEIVLGFTGAGGGPDFQFGHAYFVYARVSPENGQLSAFGCGRTRPVEEADEDIEYGRLFVAGGTSGEIFGTVRQFDRLGRQTQNVWRGITVVLRSSTGDVVTTVSGAGGRYSFVGPPAGAYTIDVSAPSYIYNVYRNVPLDLVDSRACRTFDIELDWNGRISGRVVNAAGIPVAGIALVLEAGRYRGVGTIRTNEAGHFELDQLPPGRYRIGLNIPASGSKAEEPHFDEGVPQITLAPGGHQSVADLVLPPHVAVTEFEGFVRPTTALPSPK